jgi:hypothetical protein
MTGGGIRAARNVSAGAVALIAAFSSYSHMVHVALRCGERPEVAYALPFSVDGMLVVATVVMVDDKRHAHRVRPIARLAFTAGVLASVAANIAAAHPSVGARIVDAWPAVALLLVVEMLARPPAAATTEVPPAGHVVGQPPAELRVQPPRTPQPAELPRPEPPTATGTGRRPTAEARPVPPLSGTATQTTRNIDQQTGPATQGAASALPSWSAAMVAPGDAVGPAPQGQSRRRQPTATTRQLARQIMAAEPQLPRAEVAARLGVSTRRLREVLATPA